LWPAGGLVEYYEEPGTPFDDYYGWLYCARGYFIIAFKRSMTYNWWDTSDKLSRLESIWCGRPANSELY